MLGMGPILWEIAWKRVHPKYGRLPGKPFPRRYTRTGTVPFPAAALYYKMIDRATLNLPIL